MSVSTETTRPDETPLTGKILYAVQYYLGGRRGLILLTVIALGAGLVLNWSWLVAAGVAPLLLALAPCAAMYALGLCMNKKGDKSGSTESSSGAHDAKTNPSSPPPSARVRDEA